MASLIGLRKLNGILRPSTLRQCASLSTGSSVFGKDPVMKDKKYALLCPEDIEHLSKIKSTITITDPMDVSLISGVPEEHVKERRVRIFSSSKNAMQSGTDNVGVWSMEFETRERWENPLMGWTSSGDPLSNLKLEFNSTEDAIDFCEKNGWSWYVEKEKKIKARGKSYAVNFAWNKRSRVSTK
ncbi:NADH dehydrogenase [ubiquinone] iron-sulfur protein 4, mitochondrial [Nilaparvata lugens]|uniref:NADH dehydrogenase [ubiquinone] iron-sulfur protein 4, mitochondrial n=1 Tax=Nilaparvata lugens TaxID=108931 RepID=UPI00193DE9DD|nr:NADH dehydrogenase [ubiquinone] iron-sulfur protein 4, mitochondrial [Nilaparvata lugens]